MSKRFHEWERKNVGRQEPEDLFDRWWIKGVTSFKMLAIKRIDDDIYYFDKIGICRTINVNEVRKQIEDGTCEIMGLWMSNDEEAIGVKRSSCEDIRSSVIWYKAIKRMDVGETTKRFLYLLNNPIIMEGPKVPKSYKNLEFLVTGIDRPEFRRMPENENKETFDYIVVTIHFANPEFLRERDQFIKENARCFYKMAVNKIESDYEFAKFGVPTNFLRLSKATLVSRKDYLELIFELKDC